MVGSLLEPESSNGSIETGVKRKQDVGVEVQETLALVCRCM